MSVEDYRDFQIAEKMKYIYPPILLTIGLVGNVLSIVVLSQANNRKTSTGVMLILLAVTDCLILISSVLVNWIVFLSEFDFRGSSNAACKVHVFITYLLLQLSPWILVFVTVERVFSVLYPHRVRDIFTRRRVLVAMAIFIVFLAGLNGHLLYGLQIHEENSRCQVIYEHEHFMFKIWTWIDFAFAFAIPFCVLLVGNVIVVIRLKSSRQFRTRSTIVSRDAENPNGTTSRREKRGTTPQFTITALMLNLAFMVFVSPYVTYAVGQPYWFPVESMTPKRFAKLLLIDTITKMLMYMNSGINFILYILSGTKFRTDFMKIFCCVRNQRQFTTDHTSSSRTLGSLSSITRRSNMSISSHAQPSDSF